MQLSTEQNGCIHIMHYMRTHTNTQQNAAGTRKKKVEYKIEGDKQNGKDATAKQRSYGGGVGGDGGKNLLKTHAHTSEPSEKAQIFLFISI